MKFKVLSRKKFLNSSTYPVDIITAATAHEQVIQLFCKYLIKKESHTSIHRGGLDYEIQIYNKVLKHIPLSKPKFYNDFFTARKGFVLVIEYLEGSMTLTNTARPEKLLKEAASWIGSLHRLFENKVPSFVTVYNVAYYNHWVEKVRHIKELENDYPWLKSLCTFFSDHIPLLVRHSNTFIHGEFYPMNILVRDNIIYPIDWESAAKGPGEVDLASLIEDWDEQTLQHAIAAYKASRWPQSENICDDFERVLLLSRIYLKFRWMTEFIEWWKSHPKEFQQLFLLAKKAGCITN